MALATTACVDRGAQRIATLIPTLEPRPVDWDRTRVSPAAAGALVVTGLALQLSGVVQDGQIVWHGDGRNPVRTDPAQTDARAGPSTRGGDAGASADPATMAAGPPVPPATVPFVLKLPPGMQ